MRRTNSVGPWLAFINNDGVLFNQTDAPNGIVGGTGGFWTDDQGRQDSVVFAAGLWFGGLRRRGGSLLPHAEYTYEPNHAGWMFVPGSIIYGGSKLDSSQGSRDKYRVYRSTDLAGPAWPVRSVAGRDAYIDDPSMRSTAGAPSVLGDEDMFVISKDSDPTAAEDSNGDPFDLEVRTHLSFWKKTFLKDAVLVHNEIVYSGQDTVFDPVVALTVDGDINYQGDDRTKGLKNEACEIVTFFTDQSATDPILGVMPLIPPSGTHRQPEGINSLRYWEIKADPQTEEDRYQFLIEPRHDTAFSQIGDARVLIAYLSHEPMIPGDTITFDYAMFVQPATGPALTRNDSLAMLGYGQAFTNAYHTGLHHASVPPTLGTQLRMYPDPASDRLSIALQTPSDVGIYDALGRQMVQLPAATHFEVNVSHFPTGLYFVQSAGAGASDFRVLH